MSTLSDRLRERHYRTQLDFRTLCAESADELDRLTARAEALEAALRELVRAQERYWAPAPTGGDEQRNRAMYAARKG